jgi:hypothetical protein
MATGTGRTQCATCEKEKVAYKCEGCSQTFCYNHLGEHRQQLNKQLNEIEITRDLFQQTLTQQTTEPQKHPLIQQIDQWEHDSIQKIKQTADETRQVLFKYISEHITQLEHTSNKLTNQLKLSRQEDDIIEIDLEKWKEELQQMTEQFNKPSNITIEQSSIPLINKIHVNISGT